MRFDELTYDQKNYLAGYCLIRLADDGRYAETLGVDWDEPSMEEMMNALEILGEGYVSDQMDGYDFTEDDFGF